MHGVCPHLKQAWDCHMPSGRVASKVVCTPGIYGLTIVIVY